MRTDEIKWTILPPRPVGVGFPPEVLSTDHPLTPPSVRVQYQAKCPRNETAVWANGQHCGIKIEDHEIVWRPEDAMQLDIFFMRPAKGSGLVSLSLKTTGGGVTIFVSKHFTEQMLDWTRSLCNAINSASALEIREIDNGCDA